MYKIGRPINGISLNGLEYVLDNQGQIKTFKTEKKAKDFMFANGITQEDFDNCAYIIQQD